MARKNLLKDLMTSPEAPAPEAPAASAGDKRANRGAIGAVSRSIAELKSRSVIELDPFVIRSGGLDDRLEFDEADHATLMHSLKTYGQQVPVLVRPHPETEGEYQIVYGRRRVLAMRDLNMPVKAMVRDLDDEALVMAQGQENSARRDLSFVEKANFAYQMQAAGYDRKIIADALSTDKTLISRMISVVDALTPEVIEMIGAAPGIGRDRWVAFARMWQEAERDPEDARTMLAALMPPSSDARFEGLHAWLVKRQSGGVSATPKAKKDKSNQSLTSKEGAVIGQVKHGRAAITMTLPRADGFADWLADHMDDIHRDWSKSQGE